MIYQYYRLTIGWAVRKLGSFDQVNAPFSISDLGHPQEPPTLGNTSILVIETMAKILQSKVQPSIHSNSDCIPKSSTIQLLNYYPQGIIYLLLLWYSFIY